MELEEVLRRRRMVRSFSGTQVDPLVLDGILSSLRRAPAAGNTDGCDVLVLVGDEETSRFWEATTTTQWREKSRRWPGLSRAPVVICLFTRPSAYLERYDEPDKRGAHLGSAEHDGEGLAAWPVPFWFVDAGFAALAVLLATVGAGLGACFLGNFRGEQELRSLFGVPADHRYLGAVLLGEPGGDDPAPASVSRPRRELSEVVHRGHW